MLAQAGELQKALAVVQDMKADEGTSGMAKAAAANKEMFQVSELGTSCRRMTITVLFVKKIMLVVGAAAKVVVIMVIMELWSWWSWRWFMVMVVLWS